MRKLIVLPLIAAGTLAGSLPAGEPKAPIVVAAPAAPNYYNWFLGATGGYLLDNECEFFSGHVGVDLPYRMWGWDTATYLEVGYFGCEYSVSGLTPFGVTTTTTNGGGDDDKYGKYEKGTGVTPTGGGGETDGGDDGFSKVRFDLDVIPITLNYKLERQIANNISFYWGLGAGVAIFDLDAGSGFDDDDTTFFAQGFTGLIYNVNPNFEIFTGARVIYFDEPSFEIEGVDVDPGLEDVDAIVEGGIRYTF